jgi:hypothetical protein
VSKTKKRSMLSMGYEDTYSATKHRNFNALGRN